MSDIPYEQNLKVQRELRNQGIEMAVDEIIAHRKSAWEKLQAHLSSKGISFPEGDLEFLQWMKEIGL